jgi:hypothetical protein
MVETHRQAVSLRCLGCSRQELGSTCLHLAGLGEDKQHDHNIRQAAAHRI